MKVRELAEKLNMKILTGESSLEKEIKGFYASDLLSWVMSHAGKGDAWVTVHTHLNIIAVALLVEIPCIIIPEGIAVEESSIRRAMEEGIAILGTELSTYEICWKGHDILSGNEL